MAIALAIAACSGVGSPDGIRSAHMAADTADQVMFGVATRLTNLGVKQADLEADSGYMYENAGRTDLRRIKLTFFSTAGVQQSVLTADEGTYMMRTNFMEARGNVVVVKTDGSRLTTSVLRFDQAKNEVSTDQPYTYDTNGNHAEGVGFVSDPSFRNITTSRAHGTSRGGFVLPGQ
jgi:LPS export ABC transporter protein LptC